MLGFGDCGDFVKTDLDKEKKEIVYKEKSERLMDGIGYWASFYRKNPQRFVSEVLGISLKLFQKALERTNKRCYTVKG